MQPIKYYSSKDMSIWKSTNISALYIKIKDNIPHFEYKKTQNARAESMKQMVIDTLKMYTINDVEILINIGDNPYNNPYFLSFSSTTNTNINTIPNFSFYQWDVPKSDNFFDIKKNILNSIVTWENKEDKRMWSGINCNIMRQKFNNFCKNNILYEFNLIESYEKNLKFYKLTDHTKYKYLLDIEGVGYSGRFPYLALTGSCVILLHNTDPNRDFKLYYSDDFKENIHYLKVSYTVDDDIQIIHDKIQEKISLNDCKKIGLECQKLANTIFTLDNILLYLSNVLKFYSEHYHQSDNILNPDLEYNIKMITKSINLKLRKFNKIYS
jgi:hypothetical protein